MAAHQAPPSLGFSRQEHWSGLPFPSLMHESEKWKWSRSVAADSSQPHRLQPTRPLRPWDFPGKSTGVGCHAIYLGLWICLRCSPSVEPGELWEPCLQPQSSVWPAVTSAVKSNYKAHSIVMCVPSSNHRCLCCCHVSAVWTDQCSIQMQEHEC